MSKAKAKKEEEEDEFEDSPETIVEAFKFFDKNNSGKISLDELKVILGQLGRKLEDKVVEEILTESGIQNNEMVDYKKLVKFWADK